MVAGSILPLADPILYQMHCLMRCIIMTTLLVVLHLLFINVSGVERVRWDAVQLDRWLQRSQWTFRMEGELVTHVVWILDQDVFALWLLEHEIGNGSDDTPTVRQRDIHLPGKV
jgi:hypothetical protein